MRKLFILLFTLILFNSIVIVQPYSTITNTDKQKIRIITPFDYDTNINVAKESLITNLPRTQYDIVFSSISEIENIDENEIVIIISHGFKNGLYIDNTYISWDELVNRINSENPQMTFLFSCNSPTFKEKNIFGFSSEIDAIAGSLIISWKIGSLTNQDQITYFDKDAVQEAQLKMEYPLETYLYLVHGYGVDNLVYYYLYYALQDYFRLYNIDYDSVKFFDYFEEYIHGGGEYATPEEMNDLHNNPDITISSFAENFCTELLSYSPGTQIDIIAHSLGGIITREMLRLYKADLISSGIMIGRIMTLGTPHVGTHIADHASELDLLGGALDWNTPILRALSPGSSFIDTLNSYLSYLDTIKWFTVGGVDIGVNAMLLKSLVFCGHYNDGLVPTLSATALGLFSSEYEIINYCSPMGKIAHEDFINDPDERECTYDYICPKFGGTIDTDGDGLQDSEELYIHFTDPTKQDTDGDGLTDPIEVNWGYDPSNSLDPVPQNSLIYSLYLIKSTIATIRVNDYENINYIKVYVRYRYPNGIWTAWIYESIEYTAYYYGDYKITWDLIGSTELLQVQVTAYDVQNHQISIQLRYLPLDPSSGGGPSPVRFVK